MAQAILAQVSSARPAAQPAEPMLGGAFQDPKKETASVRLENEVTLEHAQKPVELDRQWHGTKLETVLETRNDDLTCEVKGAFSDKRVSPGTWEIRVEDKTQGGGPRDPKRRRLIILCKKTQWEPKGEDVKPECVADKTGCEEEGDNRNPSDPKRRRLLRLRVKTKPERMDEVKQALDPKNASWWRGVKRKSNGHVNREAHSMGASTRSRSALQGQENVARRRRAHERPIDAHSESSCDGERKTSRPD
mmetsp:Transcript_61948/g.172976  ORF Transcript_61948/g.172976 Transcript_61948/m.172976 type:complete len:248 (+) Transcript_61948:1-744(+)